MWKDKKRKKTPSQITACMIRAAMSVNGMSVIELAKLMNVCAKTVYTDLSEPEKIPQDRLWLYFINLDISVDDALQSVANKVASAMVNHGD